MVVSRVSWILWLPVIVAFVFPAPARAATDPPRETHIVLRNVRIFDGKTPNLAEGMNVLLVGGRIEKIQKDLIETEAGALRIDAQGRVLMPGLIDMHAHLGLQARGLAENENWNDTAVGAMIAQVLTDSLQQGFTTVRDVGSKALDVAAAVRAGKIPGPRIYPSGLFITQTAGHLAFAHRLDPAMSGVVVNGRDEMLSSVRLNLRRGATQITVIGNGNLGNEGNPGHSNQFTLGEMKAAVEAAADWGTYVLVHAYDDAAVNRALDAGVRCIEHAFLISEETVQRMAAEGAAWSLQGYASYAAAAGLEPGDAPTEMAHRVREGIVNVAKWARKHGLLIVAGSDIFGTALVGKQTEPAIVQTELGFSHLEALRHVTSNAATVLGWSGQLNPYPGKLGVIEEGAYADLLLVDGDPLQDFTVLRSRKNLRLIIKDGVIYKNTL